MSRAPAPLGTEGRHLVSRPDGLRVLLRGLNLSGLEYAGRPGRAFLEAAGFSESLVRQVVEEWGANVIRLPLNERRVLHGDEGGSAGQYLEAIDRMVRWTSSAGAYTILDLQWLDGAKVFGRNADGSPNRVAPLPGAESIRLWGTLADRYRDEPSVLFDVFNEPHDPIRDPVRPERDDCHPLLGVNATGAIVELRDRRVTTEVWQAWARLLVSTIRTVHPGAVIVVAGTRWGYDLRGMPLTTAPGSRQVFRDVLYSTHVYPWSSCGAWAGGGLARRRDWRTAFGSLARYAPVFVGEWGGGDGDLRWGRRLARYLDRLDIGWAAWSWSDRPRLVQPGSDGFEPTPFGALVRAALRARSAADATRFA